MAAFRPSAAGDTSAELNASNDSGGTCIEVTPNDSADSLSMTFKPEEIRAIMYAGAGKSAAGATSRTGTTEQSDVTTPMSTSVPQEIDEGEQPSNVTSPGTDAAEQQPISSPSSCPPLNSELTKMSPVFGE